MDCHEARTLIDERVHGGLAGELAARLEDHLRSCRDCSDDLRQLEKVRSLLSAVQDDAPPAQVLLSAWKTVLRRTLSGARTPRAASSEDQPEELLDPTSSTQVEAAGGGASTVAPRRTLFRRDRERRFAPPRPRPGWLKFAVLSAALLAVLVVAFAVGAFYSENYAPRTAGIVPSAPSKGFFDRTRECDGEHYETAVTGRREAVVSDYRDVDGRLFESVSASASPPGGGGTRSVSLDDVIGVGSSGSPGKGDGGLQRSQHDIEAEVGERHRVLRESKPRMPERSHTRTELPPPAKPAVPTEGASVATPPPLSAPALVTQTSETERKKSDKEEKGKGEAPDIGAPKDGPGTDPQTAPRPRPKIIKHGDMTLEVKNALETSRQADSLVVRYGAFIADSRTVVLPTGARRVDLAVRVAPERFEELYAELKKLGTVIAERAGADDISAAFFDTEARVKNLEITEARLQDLLKNKSFVDRIQSLLEVEREITRVRGEIEKLRGQIRVWEDQISLSTLRVHFQEPDYAVPSGSMSIEVRSLSDAKRLLDGALKAAEGQLLSGATQKRGDGTLQGNYSIRVKFGRFAEVIGAVKAAGRVQDERLINQPLGISVPPAAVDAACEVQLVFYERSVPVPAGSMSIEVPTLEAAKKTLEAALTLADAQLLNGQTTKRGDGTLQGNFTLRVKMGRFAELVNALKSLGRSQDEQIQRQPFTPGLPESIAEVPCELAVVLFERSIQLPSGSLTLEVQDVPAALEKLKPILAGHQASALDTQTRREGDGTSHAAVQLRVPAGRFLALLDALAQPELGRVLQKSASGETANVAGGAADAPCALALNLAAQKLQVPTGSLNVQVEKFAAARESLSALVKKHNLKLLSSASESRPDGTSAGAFRIGIPADRVDAVVTELEKLGHVLRRDLKGLGLGDLAKVDPNLQSEIGVLLAEKPALVPQEENAFRRFLGGTFGGFLRSLGHIVQGLAVLLPWAALVFVVLFPIWRHYRRKAGVAQVAKETAVSVAPQSAARTEEKK